MAVSLPQRHPGVKVTGVAAVALALVAAASIRAQSAPTLAITHVAVVDVTEGTARPDRTVLISGNRIVSIGAAATTPVPPGARVLDGSRKFLIPGLWDMHSHAVGFGPTSLALYLANGVTGIRDMGAERFADAKAWRDRIAAGDLAGPRMRIASPIVENREWLAAVKQMSEQAGTPWTLYERFGPKSPADAVRWVDEIAALGPDHIKVRNWPEPETSRALVERARERGLPVVGHGNEPFPRKGLTTLEHQIWPPIAGSAAARDSMWRQLAANGIAVVPTLVTWPIRLDTPDALIARVAGGSLPGLQYVPARTRERWRNQLLQFKQESPMNWTVIHRDEMRNVAEMHKAGVTLLAGTDIGAPLLLPGFSLHDELALLVTAAGMTPLQALRAATIAPARLTSKADALGSVDAGKIADLVVLDANPLADIRAAKQIHAVVANGRLFDRAALDRLLADAEAAAR